ncbi:MAG: 5-formyltetrahydrofolate cyclo-ligase [Clostridiaceae bacterium]|jgi:5-formyltetrahydrofolate cyclo-ligase|nr:5-formyltetrahydrofolate cyclo-ligase [Clostridiaceae bacterium]
MENKQTLRKKYKEIRNNLDVNSKSIELCKKLRETEVYKSSNNIMTFYPLTNEIDTRDLFNDFKNFYLPKTDGENLLVCPYKTNDKMELSSFHTLEPISEPILPEKLDLVIVPALVVDKNNYRLGYGKGFYDRFISQNPQLKTVVLIPKELVIEELPIDEFDKQVDFVISD